MPPLSAFSFAPSVVVSAEIDCSSSSALWCGLQSSSVLGSVRLGVGLCSWGCGVGQSPRKETARACASTCTDADTRRRREGMEWNADNMCSNGRLHTAAVAQLELFLSAFFASRGCGTDWTPCAVTASTSESGTACDMRMCRVCACGRCCTCTPSPAVCSIGCEAMRERSRARKATSVATARCSSSPPVHEGMRVGNSV